MSLTTDDLIEIRTIIESALAKQSAEVIKPLQNEIQALRNDIKEIYDITTKFLAAAKQAGISLPR